jgi:hypothetical protein
MTLRRWAVFGACVVLAACASDGRTLREPAPGASAPPVPSSATTAPSQVGNPAGTGATSFTITSPAFAPGSPIPIVHTCDGSNVSPPLAWGSMPAGTVELALTVVDPDANNFVHWVMAGIDPSVQAIAEGTVPDGVVQATNGANTVGWTGPCPPKGAPHHYVFTLYALNAPSGLAQGVAGRDAITTITQLKTAATTLVGTYQRAG